MGLTNWINSVQLSYLNDGSVLEQLSFPHSDPGQIRENCVPDVKVTVTVRPQSSGSDETSCIVYPPERCLPPGLLVDVSLSSRDPATLSGSSGGQRQDVLIRV
ncbi:unnamed protein product [Pleuronectes platessa]|uniref:Uncharacterized protein n=1 Tax=Pleuronectes platessa TaxID=8262 RepID=A0A9N7UKS9_PLEPL|nr:unnamed protein product [Pleuronectes platessa]